MTIWTILASASKEGGATARISTQLDVTFALEDCGRVRAFHWGLFPLCFACDVRLSLTTDKTGQRGLLTSWPLEAAGSYLAHHSLFFLPHSSPQAQSSVFLALCGHLIPNCLVLPSAFTQGHWFIKQCISAVMKILPRIMTGTSAIK